jgi:hypothetical protein
MTPSQKQFQKQKGKRTNYLFSSPLSLSLIRFPPPSVFGKGGLAIYSNSAGSSDDKDFLEASSLDLSLGLKVIRHGTKKPNLEMKKLLSHFKESGKITFLLLPPSPYSSFLSLLLTSLPSFPPTYRDHSGFTFSTCLHRR